MFKIANLREKYRLLNTPVKAALWYVCVTFIDKAVSVITQPFVNRILSVEEVGLCGTYFSWYSIINIIATFYLFCGVLEVYITKHKDNTKDIVLSLCTLSLTFVSAIYLIICACMPLAVSLTGLKSRYIHLMFLTIISEAVIQFWSVPKRFEYAYKEYAILTVGLFAVKSVLSCALAYFLIADRVAGRLIGLCLPNVVAAIPIFVYIVRNGRWSAVKMYWKGAVLFNLPLIPHYLANNLLASSDRIMIERLSGLQSAGLYTVAYSFSSLSLIVFSAVNSAYNPFSMKCIKDNEYEKLTTTTEIMLIVSMLVSILMVYFAPEGLLILGGESYLEALSIVPVLVIGIFTSSFYFIFANVEFVNEKTKLIFPITAIGAGVNIFLNYVLIPIFGYEVAALTTVVGYVIIAISHYVVSYRITGKNIYNMRHILILFALFTIISLGALPVYYLSRYIRYGIILMIIIAVIIFFIKKVDILRMLFKKDY